MRVGEFAVGPVAAQRSTDQMVEQLHQHFTVERFDEWVVTAQPGARQLYGVGVTAATAAGPGVAARMRQLAECGLVETVQRRRPGDSRYPFDYIAIRCARPVPKGFPRLPSLRQILQGAGRGGAA